ncbi:MAG: hypothetical protein A2Z96_07890 [Spirochaetes bacterium GWB1_48_6]|nr:MAG: hypothetical protein A2Z96_07890 [Spirochaetes bacterium GWB1_48_6]
MLSKKLVIFATALFFAGAELWAQPVGSESGEGTVFQNYPSALGAYGNIMTGGGLTYQRWFGKAGLEATLGAMVQTDGSFEYGVQAAFQYMLFGEDFAKWFSGALYTNVLLAHTAEGSSTAGEPTYTPFGHLGLGVGIEMVFLRHLSTSVEFMYIGRIPLKVDFSVGGSLKYRF